MITSSLAVWSFWIVFLVCARTSRCGWSKLGLKASKDAKEVTCPKECNCYSWKSDNATNTFDRFTVNCSGEQVPLAERPKSIPKPLPSNTTDLIVTGYFLDTLDAGSFDRKFLGANLVRLTLHRCGIRYILSRTFSIHRMRNLRHIDLNENELTEINSDMFQSFPEIKTISVAMNRIGNIERLVLPNPNHVMLINISHNRLTEIEPGTFDNALKLELLDLSKNLLKTLPTGVVSELPSLTTLALRDNPWNCSCIQNSVLSLKHSLLEKTQAVCRYPQRFRGILISTVSDIPWLCADIFNIFYIYFVNETITKIIGAFANENTTKIIAATIIDNITITIITVAAMLLVMFLCNAKLTTYYHSKFGKISTKTWEGRKVEKMKEDPKGVTESSNERRKVQNFDSTIDEFGNVHRLQLPDGRKAAAKKYPKMKDNNELRIFLRLEEETRPHPNIIRYLGLIYTINCTYLLLELCDGNLMTAIMDRIDGFDPISDPHNYISQLTSGICYLHDNGIQHRDIKPENILWKRTATGIITLIISDFDLSRFSNEPSLHKVKCGTRGWCAPELWDEGTRSYAVDIHPLGYVFYFILTMGRHPFGEITKPTERQDNIISTTYNATLDELYKHHDEHEATMAEDLIRRMVCYNADDRITACKIKKHPFVLTNKEMLEFLYTIGCFMDKNSKDPDVAHFKESLERNSHVVFTGKWLDKLHAEVRSYLSRYKKEGNDKICSILLTVYNHAKHFHTIKNTKLGKIYTDKFGVVKYYTRLFPKLVTYTYDVLENSKIENISY